MTEEQKEFVRQHYGGSMSVSEIAQAIGVTSANITHFVKHVSYETMTETFKNFKRVQTRDFFDPLEEPDLTTVDYSVSVCGNLTVYTFQSRINY